MKKSIKIEALERLSESKTKDTDDDVKDNEETSEDSLVKKSINFTMC